APTSEVRGRGCLEVGDAILTEEAAEAGSVTILREADDLHGESPCGEGRSRLGPVGQHAESLRPSPGDVERASPPGKPPIRMRFEYNATRCLGPGRRCRSSRSG